MGALEGYQISLLGLENGHHAYTFNVDADFFQHFKNEALQNDRFEVKIDLDKHNDMFVLHFEIVGSINTACDRCMAVIQLPIQGTHKLIIKSTEGNSDDPDVEHISPETAQIELGQTIYEYILMSLPLVNTFDCKSEDPQPCDQGALKALENASEKVDSGIWDKLKNLEVDK